MSKAASSAVRNSLQAEHSPDAARNINTNPSRPFLVLLDSRTHEHIERACVETRGLTPEILIASLAHDAVCQWLDVRAAAPASVFCGASDAEDNKLFQVWRARRFAKRLSNEARRG